MYYIVYKGGLLDKPIKINGEEYNLTETDTHLIFKQKKGKKILSMRKSYAYYYEAIDEENNNRPK